MHRIYEENGTGLQRIFQEAKARRMVTSLDLCAIDPVSDAGQQDWYRILASVLPWVDLFMPSQDDLRGIFSGTPDQMAEESRRLGAGSAWIKCGTQGMVFSTGSKEHFRTLARLLHLPEASLHSWADRHGAVPATRIETLLPGGKEVSGLGAGDVTVAALLTCLMQGRPFRQAMTLALAEGALCVTQDSALVGLLPLDQIPFSSQ